MQMVKKFDGSEKEQKKKIIERRKFLKFSESVLRAFDEAISLVVS